jgi:G3E family GTPase
MATPVHILSGFLGSGKTTAIRSQLAQRRGENVAVIVNDFGEAGFDEAVIEGDAPFQITNIPGACVCCTAPEGFVAALGAILERKPDRLLIEPTGLARPQDLVDTIRRGPHRDALELAPVVVLVDPRKLATPSAEEKTLIDEQAEVADVIVANHTDVCSQEELAAFDAWAAALWPEPLAVVHTHHGEVPAERMDWPAGEGPRRDAHDHALHGHADHGHAGHTHAPASTEGFGVRSRVWAPDVVFDRRRIEESVERAAGAGGDTRLSRFKGLFRTREGHLRIEWAGGRLDVASTAHRRDSRVDVIASGAADALLDAVCDDLDAAVLGEAELRAQANQIEIVLPGEEAGRERAVVLRREDVAALDDPIADVSTMFPKRTGEAARMRALLERVGAPEAGHAVICAADGFASEPVPLHALREGVLLHGEGDAPLPEKSGGPFRLLIPEGVPDAPSACANVKAVTRIVVRGAQEP